MKKMIKNVMIGTMAGVMAAAMPFTAFASEIDAKQEVVYEVDADETQDEDGINLEGLFELFQNMSEEDSLKALVALGDLLVTDSEFRNDFTVSCIEASGVELTEQEGGLVANIMDNITFDDVVEAFQEVDFDEVFQEFETAFNKYLEESLVEEAAEIDAKLDALGQMLIDISADDILEFLS